MLNRTHLSELRNHNDWMALKKFSKNLDAEAVHPLHWQRLLQACLDPMTKFMDGHLLLQLLALLLQLLVPGLALPATGGGSEA